MRQVTTVVKKTGSPEANERDGKSCRIITKQQENNSFGVYRSYDFDVHNILRIEKLCKVHLKVFRQFGAWGQATCVSDSS